MSFQVLFWAVVFIINLGPEWHNYSSLREALEVVGLTTALQMLVAFVAVRQLVPRWLDQGAVLRFLGLFLALLMVAAQINILVSYFYLEPAYPASYGAYYQRNLADVGLLQRLGFSYLSKYILLSKLPHLAFPAAVLIAVNYYRQQQALLELREQQRAAELEALKKQLNPHFIFNTLNNIYALALQRSEHTAEAVARLSSILDYVLHRGSDTLVSLNDEVTMIEAYVALEQLRFSNRLAITFTNQASPNHRVPPLLFLTLLENAFKHGVAKSLGDEQIEIALSNQGDGLCFEIRNSLPPAAAETTVNENAIGLRNLRRQLALQCPNNHQLTISQTDRHYSARLVLNQTCQNATPASSSTTKHWAGN
ncbi:MAG: hypothetical protein Tsb002_36360 [Wenzhouxiangellaceae bacterium]